MSIPISWGIAKNMRGCMKGEILAVPHQGGLLEKTRRPVLFVFWKRTNGHKPTMQMIQTTQRRGHLALTTISRNWGIARSLGDNIKE